MANKTNHKKRVSKITEEMLERLLIKANGIQAVVADTLGMSRPYICERVAASPRLQAAIATATEMRIDRAEEALDRLMTSDNITAVIFCLKTLGRKRGYVEHAPTEILDTSHLRALQEFFASVPQKKPLSAAPPQELVDVSPETPEERSAEQSASPSIETPPEATQSASADPGLSRGKIVRLGSNFP